MASEAHWPVELSPCMDTHTVIEFGLIDPVHGKGVSVAVTIVAPLTCTTEGGDKVKVHDGSGASPGSALAGYAMPIVDVVNTLARTATSRSMAGWYKR